MSDCSPRDIIDRTGDLRDIFARVRNPGDIFARASSPNVILGCIGDLDPSAIFFSDPYPSLWLTGRLKHQLSQLQRAGQVPLQAAGIPSSSIAQTISVSPEHLDDMQGSPKRTVTLRCLRALRRHQISNGKMA
ncbi:MAG: hypothetical protein GY835_02665, partial [bacterium]|nr:hypothetical protein [bacterium]